MFFARAVKAKTSTVSSDCEVASERGHLNFICFFAVLRSQHRSRHSRFRGGGSGVLVGVVVRTEHPLHTGGGQRTGSGADSGIFFAAWWVRGVGGEGGSSQVEYPAAGG